MVEWYYRSLVHGYCHRLLYRTILRASYQKNDHGPQEGPGDWETTTRSHGQRRLHICHLVSCRTAVVFMDVSAASPLDCSDLGWYTIWNG